MLFGDNRHPAALATATEASVHRDVEVAHAWLPDDAGGAKVSLYENRQVSEIGISDWRGCGKSGHTILDVFVIFRSQAEGALAQEPEHDTHNHDGICERADFRVRPRWDDGHH